MNIIRQGDLTFVHITDPTIIRSVRTQVANPITVLALGESSGHCHECEETVSEVFLDDLRYLVVDRPTRVIINPPAHQGRHHPINLLPGVYRIPGQPDDTSKWLGQREYAPEATRGVTD